ncbi:MAG: 4Fe-4S binding protein, partial [Candidatus Omnitrophota bacterium]
MKKTVILKRVSQTLFLSLFVYILWSTTYPLKGFLPPETFFRTNPNIMIFTSISERLLLPGLLFSVLMILLTLIFGRFYCGWVCPLGTMIDWSYAVTRKSILSRNAFEKFRIFLIKFFILLFIGIFSLAGIQLAWILDPMSIMARFISMNLIPGVTSLLNNFFI